VRRGPSTLVALARATGARLVHGDERLAIAAALGASDDGAAAYHIAGGGTARRSCGASR
jgi:hypothetical protein